MSTQVKRKSLTRFGALALAVASLLSVAATTSTPATAAPTPPGDAGILVDERQCNVGEVPRQIVLFLGIDGDDGVRCFGGTLGSITLPNLDVWDVFSGDYTGVLDCWNNLYFFKPNQRPFVIDRCHELTILPAT